MTSSLLITAAIALYLGASPAFAQRGRGFGGLGASGGMGPQGGMRGTPAEARRTHTAPETPSGRERRPGTRPVSLSPEDKLATRLAQHPALASRLQSLLPTGTDLQSAATGFKNLGQFVAAVHVAHNLNIPFDQLHAKLTGPNHESLGKAIQELAPNASAKEQVRRARRQTKTDLEEAKQQA